MTKTIIQSVILFVAIVGAYSFYQQWNAYQEQQVADEAAYRASFEGTHIMGNGDIMKPDGTILNEATITEDGMIMLPDGLIITPAFDMRPTEKEIGVGETMTMDEMMDAMHGEETEEMDDMMDMMGEEMEEEMEEMMIQPNPDGTHIMPNGDVMRGDGKVLSDAIILDDGNIQLSDGTVIVPAFDLR